ncbi:MAG: hypothetical protein R3E90_07885 [Marinicella sp.]
MKTISFILTITSSVFYSSSSNAQWGGYANQSINNPFCNVPTYIVMNEPRNAGINLDFRGNYYITVSRKLSYNRSNLNAMLAHECGHVQAGHGRHGYNPFQIKSQELQADCTAARTLKRNRDYAGLNALKEFVGSCGNMPSGHPSYPTCNERLRAINSCS